MDTFVMPKTELSKGRLLILGASSVILCLSFIMTVFAPFPLALAHILYGRFLGIITGVAGLVVSFAVAKFLYADLTLFWFYVLVFLFAVGIAEILKKNISPVKGMVVFGLGFIALFGALSFGYFSSQNTTPKAFVLEQIELSKDKISEQKKLMEQSSDKDSFAALQLLDNPEMLATELIRSFPSYFFIGVFLMLWFNMFLSLKSRRLLLSGHDYPYSERNLLNFKVPFGFVFVLIAGLVIAIWGKDMGIPYEGLGLTIIKCLGIFYFFQGFGVFSDLLSFLGIAGLFRSLIVMLVILMANYLIAIAGLFDNWFDFRKYFVKQKIDQ